MRWNSFEPNFFILFDIFLDSMRHLVLPVVTLSVISWAFLLRVTRSSMLDTLRQEYPLSLHGVGLSLGSADALDATRPGR